MTDQMFTEKGYYIYSDQIKIEAGLLVLLIVTMTTFFIILNALVIKKIINFSLSLIKISMHNLFLMDFFFHRNGQMTN